jgi:maleylpyruvate isomerase
VNGVTDDMLMLIDDATGLLAATTGPLADADVAASSLLPGWSRGHLLTHIARNADALRNLLIWARTGVETPAYASSQAREADIEAGAGRSAAALRADLVASATAFRVEAATLDDAAWRASVNVLGTQIPATEILTRRLTEVVLHHTDLGCGYGRGDWPAAFAAMQLPEALETFRATR